MIGDRPLALDLCSGAGGMTLALERAGYRTIGFDNWQPAIDTHHANGLMCWPLDIQTAIDDFWLDFRDDVELLAGGPPCQPFSSAGIGAGRYDPRDCIPAYIRAVRLVQPRMFLMENVRGLTFKRHAAYLRHVLDDLEACGYAVDHRVLNAADFGVPQTRERLIVLGVRNDVGPVLAWPAPVTPRPTIGEAFGWTDPDLLVWGAGRTSGATAGAQPRHVDEPAATITGAGTAYVEGDGIARRLDHAESALLQGFPADFTFVGGSTIVYKLIGNAVPPPLAQAVAEANLRHPAEAVA